MHAKALPLYKIFSRFPFFYGATAPSGQGLPHYASRIHSDKQTHTVGILWTSDRTDAENSLHDNTWQSRETDIHVPAGFEHAIPPSG